MTRSQTYHHRILVTALVAACRRLRDELHATGHTAPHLEAASADDLAQTVTLALLHTRLSGAVVTTGTLHDLGALLAAGDPPLGRALRHVAGKPPVPGQASNSGQASAAGPAPAPRPAAPRDENRNRRRRWGLGQGVCRWGCGRPSTSS